MNSQIAGATDRQEQAAQSIKHNVMGIKSTSAEAMAGMQDVEEASRPLKDIALTLGKVTGQIRVECTIIISGLPVSLTLAGTRPAPFIRLQYRLFHVVAYGLC